MERAKAYIAAAQHELEVFEESSARRALVVAADYMITRDR
jgi:octaprenyl-diphosphate synthase